MERGVEAHDLRSDGSFVVEFASERPGADEFGWALQALDSVIAAGAWMEAAVTGDGSPAYSLMRHAGDAPKADSRFFPEFGSDPVGAALSFLEGIDPFDPLDAGVVVGLNSWLRAALAVNPAAYGRSLDTLQVEEVGQGSPIFLVLALPVIVKGVGVAAVSAGAVLATVDRYYSIKQRKAETKKADAETRLVEQQALEVEARTEQIRAEVREHQDHDRRAMASELAERLPEADPKRLSQATEVGNKLSAMVIHELERNPSVSRIRRDGREFGPGR